MLFLRTTRRSCIRWACLSNVLTLRMISSKVGFRSNSDDLPSTVLTLPHHFVDRFFSSAWQWSTRVPRVCPKYFEILNLAWDILQTNSRPPKYVIRTDLIPTRLLGFIIQLELSYLQLWSVYKIALNNFTGFK